MLNWCRFLWILFSSKWRSPLKMPFDVSRLNLRCGFFDADITIANNSSFLRLMELGRLDLMARTGFLKSVIKHKWSLPLASLHIVYRRPLKRWQKFELTTRVLYWEGDYIFVEHRMESGGKLLAHAYLKSVLLEKDKNHKTQKRSFDEILRQLGQPSVAPEMPPELRAYRELDEAVRSKNL